MFKLLQISVKLIKLDTFVFAKLRYGRLLPLKQTSKIARELSKMHKYGIL